jgi:hypothetical protein
MAVNISTLTIMQALVVLIWAALDHQPGINALFQTVFYELEVVCEVLALASVSTCPGLLDVLKGVTPPSIEFLRAFDLNALGLHLGDIWAIYFIILWKHGCLPLIYFGSATCLAGGVQRRWAVYNGRTDASLPLPKFVRAALLDGYVIEKKGLLCWGPKPDFAKYAVVRLLYVALEAALSFWFWAMLSSTKDYSITSCCPWTPGQDFDYAGLCGHSSLCETVLGKFDLTGAQVAQLTTRSKQRKTEKYAKWYHKRIAVDPHYFKERSRDSGALYRERHPERVAAAHAASEAKIKAARTYFCKECYRPFRSQRSLNDHTRGKFHKIRVEKLKRGVTFPWKCKVCWYSSDTKQSFTSHCQGARHKQRVAEAAETDSEAESDGEVSSSVETDSDSSNDVLEPVLSNGKQQLALQPQGQPVSSSDEQAPALKVMSGHVDKSTGAVAKPSLQNMFVKREFKSSTQTKLSFGSTKSKAKSKPSGSA